MKKLLFILCIPSFAYSANIPEFKHKDPIIQREFESVGNELVRAKLLPDLSGLVTSTTTLGTSTASLAASITSLSASTTTLGLTASNTNYIQNTNTEQSASFYVTSGTISGFSYFQSTASFTGYVHISSGLSVQYLGSTLPTIIDNSRVVGIGAAFIGSSTLNRLAGGKIGQVLFLINETGGTVTINHNTGAIGDRFLCPGSANYSVTYRSGVIVIFSGSSWYIMEN